MIASPCTDTPDGLHGADAAAGRCFAQGLQRGAPYGFRVLLGLGRLVADDPVLPEPVAEDRSLRIEDYRFATGGAHVQADDGAHRLPHQYVRSWMRRSCRSTDSSLISTMSQVMAVSRGIARFSASPFTRPRGTSFSRRAVVARSMPPR